MFLETKLLILRKLFMEDFDRFWGMINDPIAKEYTGGVTRLIYRKRQAVFEQECSLEFSANGAEFAVIEKECGIYIGYCGFRYSEKLCGCEFLFGYCRDCWGKGYATEAAYAVLEFLFKTYSHETYIATVDIENTASKRVLEKVGFVKEDDVLIYADRIVEKYQLQKCDFLSSL